MAWLVLLYLFFVPLDAFIINSKHVNEDGLKVFTVSNEIKHNNCSCACNCLHEQLPLDKPLQAPAPPIANAPKQFIIKKVIRNNDCNCACSCVPDHQENQQVDERIQTVTPHQHNEVQSGILEELRTTIEESIALTTKPASSPTRQQQNQVNNNIVPTDTTRQYQPETTTQNYRRTEASREETTDYRVQPPKTTTGYVTRPPETTTGYVTGPPKTSNSLSGFWPTLPLAPIANPGPSLQNLFNSLAPPTTTQPPLPPNRWPIPPVTNPVAPQPPPFGAQPSPVEPQPFTNQFVPQTVTSNPFANIWSPQNWFPNLNPNGINVQVSSTNVKQKTKTKEGSSRHSSNQTHFSFSGTGSSGGSNSSEPASGTESTGVSSSGSAHSGSSNSPTTNEWQSTGNGSGPELPNLLGASTPLTNNGWPSTTNEQSNSGAANPSDEWQSTTNEQPSPWTSRGQQQTTDGTNSNNWQTTNSGFQQTTLNPSDTNQSTLPNQPTSNLPEITTDNEIATQTTNRNDASIPENQNFAESQTTSGSSRQSSSWWTKQPAEDRSFVPGLEISPGGIDASFTKSVAITSTKLQSSAPTVPAQEVSGDTQHATTISTKSPTTVQFTAELNDQPATTIQQNVQQNETINPDFKEKVHTLLERLRLQLQKMKNEEAAKTSETTVQPENHEEKLDEMRVDLQQILAKNSINYQLETNEAKNTDTTKTADRKELMRKLDAIRGMLDKMKTRTTTLEPTTQVTIQTTLATNKKTLSSEQPFTKAGIVTSRQPSINVEIVTSQQSFSPEQQPTTNQSPTFADTTTITPNTVTESKLNELESTEITKNTESISTSTFPPTTSHNQEFLHRLHEKLMNLKSKLNEMRQKMSQTTPSSIDEVTTQTIAEKAEDRPDFDQLNAQLANIKNSFDSASSDNKQNSEEKKVNEEQIMRKQMQETLDQLKQTLNKMQNEQRTTISVLSSVSTTTPINRAETSSAKNSEESAATQKPQEVGTKDEKIVVDFDSENTPESATLGAVTQPKLESTSTSVKLSEVNRLITDLETAIRFETTTQLAFKQEAAKNEVNSNSEATTHSPSTPSQEVLETTQSATSPLDTAKIEETTKSELTTNHSPKILRPTIDVKIETPATRKEVPTTLASQSTTQASTAAQTSKLARKISISPKQTTKNIPPEAETEARQSTEQQTTGTSQKTTLTTLKEETVPTTEIESTTATTQRLSTELSGPAFIQQLDESQEQLGSTTLATTQISNELKTETIMPNELATKEEPALQPTTLSLNDLKVQETQTTTVKEELKSSVEETTISFQITAESSSTFTQQELTTLVPVTQSNEIRRKPTSENVTDENQVQSSRRGLEITQIFRSNQFTKGVGIEFNRDESEETFVDLGSADTEIRQTKLQRKTTAQPAKKVSEQVVKTKEETYEDEPYPDEVETTVGPVKKVTGQVVKTREESAENFSDEVQTTTKPSQTRRKKPTVQTIKWKPEENDEVAAQKSFKPNIQATTQQPVQTTTQQPLQTTDQPAESTTHWIHDYERRKTIQDARLRLIDTIINSSTRLIGESMRSTSNSNFPQLAAPGEPFGVISESRVPAERFSPSSTDISNLGPTDILQSKNVENWIRKSPQKTTENVEAEKLFDSKDLNVPNEQQATGSERSLGLTPTSDRQLFSFIDKLMKAKAPETDPKLKLPIEPTEPVEQTEQLEAPNAKPIQRIQTTGQIIPHQGPFNRPSNVPIHLTTRRKLPTMPHAVTQPSATVRSRNGVAKSSDEIYDDYQEHDPTLAPDTPTRTPRIQPQIRVEEKLSKLDESFSVDASPSVVSQVEEVAVTTNVPTTVRRAQISDEAILIQRLEEARRLREKLEKSQLEETAANAGIHFQSNLERRHQIEAKLAKLAEAERWHRTLLERAQLNKQAHATVKTNRANTLLDGEVKMAPTAKPMRTTPLSSTTGFRTDQPTVPKHCQPVLKFVEMYQVTDPKTWIHENCQRIKQFYPNTSCQQIEELLAVCFTE